MLFIYGSYLLSNTDTHTHAHPPRRGPTVNQTFRHPDSDSAAMSIIGQERERREASGRRVPHEQKEGEAHHLPPECFCGERRDGTSVSLVQRHLVMLH